MSTRESEVRFVRSTLTARRVAGVVCTIALLAGVAGVVAPAASAFEPTLSYYKCPPKSLPAGVQCAKLTVPLDWQSPNDGRTTTIDVRVMRSKEGKGGLTFNPGGPGGSGIEALPGVYSLLPDEVVSTFDFVAWDPRGVGGSGPKIIGPAQPFVGLGLESGESGGAEIAEIKPGSPAAKAGLVKGDIITKVSDRVIGTASDVVAEVLASVPGESLVVEFRRGGASREVTVIVGSEDSGCQYPNLYPPSTGPVDWREFWQKVADENGAANAACLAANPDSAPYVGTWQVIRDLNALRVALGYSAWNYWGMSYGTRIGYAYARTFPSKLRALIMDGSMPAGETTYALGTSFPANAWISRQLFPALAAPETARKITVIEDSLNAAVVALPDGTEFTRWDWTEQFRTLLTAQSQYPTARALVNNLYGGITAKTPAARTKQLAVVAAIAAGVRSMMEGSMKGVPVQVLVNCSDLHDRPTVTELAAASEPSARNFGSTSPTFIGNSAACFGLAPEDLSPAVSSASGMVNLKTPPVFVLSSGDAATPWVWGRSLANTFAGSSTITYESTQHVDYLFTPSDCVNAAVTEYLITLKLPPRHRQCAYSPGGPVAQR
jgi:pimeloyl-ACP methyl ester carboxylesterase